MLQEKLDTQRAIAEIQEAELKKDESISVEDRVDRLKRRFFQSIQNPDEIQLTFRDRREPGITYLVPKGDHFDIRYIDEPTNDDSLLVGKFTIGNDGAQITLYQMVSLVDEKFVEQPERKIGFSYKDLFSEWEGDFWKEYPNQIMLDTPDLHASIFEQLPEPNAVDLLAYDLLQAIVDAHPPVLPKT